MPVKDPGRSFHDAGRPVYRRAIGLMAVMIVGLAAAACGGGKENSDGKPVVRIATNGAAKQAYLPLKLTQQLGYFKEQGVDVKVSDVKGGGEVAVTQMLSGEADGVVGFYDHTIDLQPKGKKVQSIVQFLTVPGTAVVCRNDLKGKVKSPADWAGRRVGSAGLGSSSDMMLQYLTVSNGVDLSKVKRLGVGEEASFVSAMQKKSIACGITTEPTITSVVNKGVGHVLIDFRTVADTKKTLGGTYPATCLYMTTGWVEDNKETAQKLVNAFVKTMRWIRTHTAAQITAKLPTNYSSGVGKDAYIKALKESMGMFTKDGTMPGDGPKTVLNVISRFNPTVKKTNIDLPVTYTDSFTKKANAKLK